MNTDKRSQSNERAFAGGFLVPRAHRARRRVADGPIALQRHAADPVRYSAGVDTYGISQVFEQLLRIDPSGKTVNWQAQSYSVGARWINQ